MDILEVLQGTTADWERASPAPKSVLNALIEGCRLTLPPDYLTLLQFSNGGEGKLGVEPGWFQIWPAQEVLEFNRVHEVDVRLPGFFGFGSSGGGELLAIHSVTGKIYMIPFIGMAQEEARLIASRFAEFVAVMGRKEHLAEE